MDEGEKADKGIDELRHDSLVTVAESCVDVISAVGDCLSFGIEGNQGHLAESIKTLSGSLQAMNAYLSEPAQDGDTAAQTLARMNAVVEEVYWLMFHRGVGTRLHPLLEFVGVMREYLRICGDLEARGIDYRKLSVHSLSVVEIEPYRIEYLAEKLSCIFAPMFRGQPGLAVQFAQKLTQKSEIPAARKMRVRWTEEDQRSVEAETRMVEEDRRRRERYGDS